MKHGARCGRGAARRVYGFRRSRVAEAGGRGGEDGSIFFWCERCRSGQPLFVGRGEWGAFEQRSGWRIVLGFAVASGGCRFKFRVVHVPTAFGYVQHRARPWAGADPGFTSSQKLRANLRKIAKLIGELNPDIVALQEIDERSLWAGNFDHLEYLRLHSGFKYTAHGVHNRRAGLLNLNYGNALLSRHPIMSTETVVFGKRSVGEKGFLFAELDVNGRVVPVVNLHLHFGSREHRIRQIGRLLAWMTEKQRHSRSRWHVPAIVCGDLNNPGTSADATAALLSHLSDYGEYVLHPATGGTFPSPWPGRLLDFVFLPSACSVAHCEIVRCYLSDHRPVMVDFELPGEGKVG